MKAFAPYRAHLESLLGRILADGIPPEKESVAAALDGQPASELRRLVPVETLRSVGAFFTGSRLSKRLASRLRGTLGHDSVILDPACGTGDLLLACASLLPFRPGLEQTLEGWRDQLLGRDLQPEFIRAARARLALAALQAGARPSRPHGHPAKRLVGIQVGSGLAAAHAMRAATHIVLNPPFTAVAAPDDCEWAGGKINAASLFLEACVKQGRPGTRIVAILPDVLRSGGRYEKWRRIIRSRSRILGINLLGQFDRWADVDVFLLDLLLADRGRSVSTRAWTREARPTMSRLADHFILSVGPVVDYREPRQGRWHPFIRARDIPSGGTVRFVSSSRRFAGRLIAPPFVVVRRTSRFGDTTRAAATAIAGERSIAVENHLIVLTPRDGSLARCVEAVGILGRPATNAWLNQRIRCRHLTLEALADVPWKTL
jgi:hypothetical protein